MSLTSHSFFLVRCTNIKSLDGEVLGRDYRFKPPDIFLTMIFLQINLAEKLLFDVFWGIISKGKDLISHSHQFLLESNHIFFPMSNKKPPLLMKVNTILTHIKPTKRKKVKGKDTTKYLGLPQRRR
jgi:hypothetical protein